MPLPELRRRATRPGAGRRAALVLCAAGLALAVGCGKRGKNAELEEYEPTVEATLTPDELIRNSKQYDGKWVIVVGHVPHIYRLTGPDGREHAHVQVGGGRRRGGVEAEFSVAEWARTPKFEDGVTYKVFGLVQNTGEDGLRFTRCRVVGAEADKPDKPDESPPPGGTLTAENLGPLSARYQGKRVQVKGTIRWGFPSEDGGSVELDAPGDAQHSCWLELGEFEKVRRAGRGGEVELKGVVTKPGASVRLEECTVVRAAPTRDPVAVAAFAREFVENPDAAREKYRAEKGFRFKVVHVTGKVQSVEDGKITFETVRLAPEKSATVVATFIPSWRGTVSRVKPGDAVVLSGEYRFHREGEVELNDCWLMHP